MTQVSEKTLEHIAEEHASHAHVGHIVPLKLLVATFLALVVLTVVTVAASWVDLGKANLWLAMFIAMIKASVVVLFFMHMRYDRPLNAIVFVSSLLFVVLFICLALTDTREYQPQIDQEYSTDLRPAASAT